MKFRLLEFIRCPICVSIFRLEDPAIHQVERTRGSELAHCGGLCPFPEVMGCPRDCLACLDYEVMGGFLSCSGCFQRYPIDEGIPQLYHGDFVNAIKTKVRTASSYGYLWDRSTLVPKAREPAPYHFDRMEQALSLPSPYGLVLDAGCGDGVDIANLARRAGVEIVGVELSEGGCRISFQRSLVFPSAHVVQADLCRLPFDDNRFDFVHSYGVLHHLASPKEGLRELVRVLKPDMRAAVYLYKDFSDRAVGWQWLLVVATQLRRITSRLSHRVLYSLCQVASPLIYALFTLPFRILRRIPGLERLASGFPFRHATGPFSLTGDLYDRFSVPIEWRYSRAEAVALFQAAGLQDVTTVKERGWMITGTKPWPDRSCAG